MLRRPAGAYVSLTAALAGAARVTGGEGCATEVGRSGAAARKPAEAVASGRAGDTDGTAGEAAIAPGRIPGTLLPAATAYRFARPVDETSACLGAALDSPGSGPGEGASAAATDTGAGNDANDVSATA